MRNAAGPIGADAKHQSPVAAPQSRGEHRKSSDAINRGDEEEHCARQDDHDADLTMPPNDSTSNTKI